MQYEAPWTAGAQVHELEQSALPDEPDDEPLEELLEELLDELLLEDFGSSRFGAQTESVGLLP